MSSLLLSIVCGVAAVAGLPLFISYAAGATLNEYFVVEDAIMVNGSLILQCKPHEAGIDHGTLLKRARSAGYDAVNDCSESNGLITLTRIQPRAL